MRETMKYNPTYYQLRKEQLQRILAIYEQQEQAKPNGVVFFGDSITEMYNIKKYYPMLNNTYNCGVAGAVAQELLWIVDEAVIKCQPKVVTLMIGVNDLGRTTMASPKEIANRVKAIIEMIVLNCPQTEVLLLSTLPCIEELESYHQVPGIRSNDLIAMIYSQYQDVIYNDRVTMLNIFPEFVDETGNVKVEYYQDGLHLNDRGYEKLTSLLKEPILELLAK
jgi:lysophospholipase L1-like esterase